MKAIILAGGKGLRLREVINGLPKPMAPVCGRPFLEYLILNLARYGITDIILSTGYRKEAIKSYFDDGRKYGVNVDYSEEETPLGTAGAIKQGAALAADNYVIAMNGDSFLDMDFSKFIAFHKETNASALLALASAEDTARYGRVITDEKGIITEFREKGMSGPGLINGGVYILGKETLETIPEGEVSFETDVLPGLIGKGLYGMKTDGYFVDIGIPQDYHALCADNSPISPGRPSPGLYL